MSLEIPNIWEVSIRIWRDVPQFKFIVHGSRIQSEQKTGLALDYRLWMVTFKHYQDPFLKSTLLGLRGSSFGRVLAKHAQPWILSQEQHKPSLMINICNFSSQKVEGRGSGV